MEVVAPPGRAVWLALEPHPVLAFLYGVSDPARTAVLFCPGFGWEEMCCYRGRRAWAQAMAAEGFPAATFGLPGTGDSVGSPRDPGLPGAWVGSASAAAEWLAAASGAERVAAVGLGLGGILAYRALAAGAPIDDLILWGVRPEGRTWVRELRAYARIIGSRHPEDHDPTVDHEGELEYTGFLLSDEAARDLESIRLTELELPRLDGRRVLLLGRDATPPDARLHEHLEQAGATVTVAETDDYRSLMLHPQESEVPTATIATTISWLREGAAADRAPGGSRAPRGLGFERESVEFASDGATVHETPVTFNGESDELFGVLAQSAAQDGPAPVCAVWLGAGALRHIGPNRVWVESARRWAARGVPTLRVDLAGIGDSEGPAGPMTNADFYPPERIRETLAILDQLSARGVADRFVLGGLCSGAYWSLHAALTDDRVAGLLLLNLSLFFWSDELIAERQTHGSLDVLRGRGWRRIVRGGVSRARVRVAVASLRPTRLRAGAGRPVERAQQVDIERALDRLRDARAETLLLFSRGEALHDQLERQGVLERIERWPNLTVEVIPSRNHMFRALWLQRHVHGVLDRALGRTLERALEAGPGDADRRTH